MIELLPEGPATEALCETVRATGTIARICELVAHPTPLMHQASLMLLATFTTIEVDAHAEATRVHPLPSAHRPLGTVCIPGARQGLHVLRGGVVAHRALVEDHPGRYRL